MSEQNRSFMQTGATGSDFDRGELIRRAMEMLPKSYSPYSRFRVSAAVLCDSGKIYTGVNVENASYPASQCAETNAVTTAVSSGERRITAVAITAGPDGVISDYVVPCGVCRQVMREFSNPDELVVIMARSEEDYIEKKLSDLLPMSFGPEDLLQ